MYMVMDIGMDANSAKLFDFGNITFFSEDRTGQCHQEAPSAFLWQEDPPGKAEGG